MTSILEDWGKKLLEKLIKRTIDEARFLFCFTCIAKEFEEERANLQPERETLEQHVKEAKGRNKDIAANVVSWEEDVKKLFQEDTKANQTCFFGFCPDCIWRYRRGKKLTKDIEKIKGLIEKADKFGNIEVSRPPPGVEHKSSQDYISFESRLSEYKELLDALKDDNNYITGLQGMGGTGKTTLAIKVGKELKESGQFTCVIDTTVSFTPDIKKIQDDIAGPLGLKWEDCNESERPRKLWDRLTKGEKILLILDDVWDQDPLLDFGAIGIPKRDNHKGCRVLVTTRSKQLSNRMNFDKSIELNPLSEDDAWIMFKRYANISESSSKDLENKGREIAKECKQLPVAIAVIAPSLKGQQNRVEKWDAILTSLKKHVPTNDVEADVVVIYKCLKVSYDNMKDRKAKELFLLCSLFREDEEISIEVLTRIAIGAGLFGKDYGTYDDARINVAVSKYDLVDSCLLLEVDKKHVKMHDLVRDMAQRIASKEIRVVNLSKKKSLVEWDVNIRYLSFEGNKIDLFSCKFDGSKLKTLIVNIERDEDCVCHGCCACLEVPDSFFENIVGLQVLHFSSNVPRQISLPKSFQLLANIRSLFVNCVDLGDISVLGNLQSLEALELVKCTIHELPIEIGKLENLKLLRLETCEIRKDNPFEVIKKCSSLEELYFIYSFNDFCREITLPAKLRRYHIAVWIRENEMVFTKHVVLDKKVFGYFTKGTLEYFMETAEAIELFGINSGWRNLMPEVVPIENGMNDLVKLHLSWGSELQCLIDTKHIDSQVPNVVFSKLVVLELFKMDKLEELCNGSISMDSLNCLKEVTIESCEHLQSLFKCSLNHLCNLKNVTLTSCSTLISVFDLTSSQGLPQLESLNINFCSKLENIFTYERLQFNDNSKSCNSMFPNLKVLSIYQCPQLQFILPYHSAGNLLSLESIMIQSCDKLTQLIKPALDDTIEEKVKGDNDNNNSCNSIMFPNLKGVQVISCPQLQFVLPLQSAQDLLLLQSVTIMECDKLKHIFGQHQDVQLALLEKLYLVDLPNFINIFPESDHSMPSSIKRSSNSISKTQTKLEPVKSNIFSWSHICCHRYKFRASTSTEISLERQHCLSRLSHIMCNIKVISLSNLSKIKSVFVLSMTSRMMLESLTIENCDELKHIVVDIGDSSGSDNSVFPKLKRLEVKNCGKLEYIFGHIDDTCS
ncbi:putative P-loop containing nucleoside triphosphate hydrolase, leucine-rich repeat domain, L [Medicago truncatula]|uniref:Putative P-loop containing nucleoside triphosphate hydrolase, leucine-rich repeat domain, L n=1 Tax=Medicago truncatula TaxID=3880 RepID=A0A396IQ95_MEDTR|nr:putative P-loop containing nucleoside triphosphate hydrolase, leucine-rich repeat domain, L [Medicago truncatula]